MGARELREGVSGTPTSTAPRDIVSRLSVEQLLDAMAIRLDGPRAAEHQLRIDWVVTDPDEAHALTVRNGVLGHRPGRHEPAADAALVVDRAALDELLLKTADIAELAESGRLKIDGEGASSASCSTCSTSPTPASRSSLRSDLEHQLVGVAPAPVLARLGRADDRVLRVLVMSRRVFPLRVVAAADVAAGLAHPQMHPAHPERQALLAAVDLRWEVDHPDRIEMGAGRSRMNEIRTLASPGQGFD